MVDLGGYIIILMNDNGKIRLYGSSADNADNPEVGDEILEVNGRTLENATDAEVSQHIHQCIKSGTISLQVTRRTGNKMKELDGPNADRIRDAWVIALERGARERLQRLPALRKIQPRDIQAILHQQITEGSASTSTGETPKKDITNSHITVTLADICREPANRNVPVKLSNGTVSKGIGKVDEDSKDRKDFLEKQRSCPEEANLLQPVQSGRSGERRASSPFQNGRTELLIRDTEGGSRSPRGSTSSATNDANFLIPGGDSDHPESIYKSRRRSTSGVGDIHLQQSQLQENNNGGSRDLIKGVGVDTSVGDSRVDLSVGRPDEMWAPITSPGHHRELPVDVPDTLLEQAYANKQVMSLMLNRSERTSSSTSSSSRKNIRTTDLTDETNFNVTRSARDHENTNNLDNRHKNRHQSNMLALKIKTNVSHDDDDDVSPDRVDGSSDIPRVEILHVKPSLVGSIDDNQNDSKDHQNRNISRVTEINVINDNREISKVIDDDEVDKRIDPFAINDNDDEDDRVIEKIPTSSIRDDTSAASVSLLQKETSVDADEDYPFAKEDYPTMLKTCSDDSASPRSSSGRSDSTAPMDESLILVGKESPLYDARRIDLGSPCRPLVPEIKVYSRARESTSFDNPAYGLSTDLHDLHQGLLMRSEEVNDLTRLIDEHQILANGKKSRDKTGSSQLWTSKDHSINQVHQMRNSSAPADMTKSKKKASGKIDRMNNKSRSNRDDPDVDGNGLLGAGSTDDLLNGEMTNLAITRSIKKKKQQIQQQQQQSSSGYSTLRSDVSGTDIPDQQIRSDRSFLVVGNRSYREVAVDCPADFVPIAKTHPVYPPPNRTDGTIERSSALTSLKIDGNDNKVTSRFSAYVGDYEKIGTSSRENILTTNDDKDDDDKLRPRVKSNDFRNEVVCALGRTQEPRLEKVRSKVKRRVMRYTSCINLLANNNRSTNDNNIINAYSARNYSKNRLNASHNDASYTHAYNYSTTALQVKDKMKKNLYPWNKRLRPQSEYVNDKIPRARSTFDLMQRETNENSRNSIMELVSPRDSTPIIVYYSSKAEKNWLLQDDDDYETCRVISINENDESIDLNDTANLQNAKNSKLSIEYDKNDNSESDDSLWKNNIDDSTSSHESRTKLNVKYKSHIDIDRLFQQDKSIHDSRFWLSESCLVCDDSKIGKQPVSPISRQFTAKSKIRNNSRTKLHQNETIPIAKNEDTRDQAGLNGVKPAIPPRDQKRAPARPPKDNVRLSTRNNNIEATDSANTPEPTQQQINSIKKYQDQLRRRKEEDERQQSLNQSLRSSKQLKALENHTTSLAGQENPAYAQDEVTSIVTRSTHETIGQTKEVDEPPKVLTYGEVVATLERLQLQLRNLSGALGISGPGVEAELEAVRTLLIQRRFATALATHQALKTRLRTNKILKHHDDDASNLARDCVEVLEEWQSSSDTRSMVEELTSLLTSYEMEGLLLAHDSIISYVDGIQRKQSPSSSSPSRSPSPSSSLRGSRNTDNIKIIRIEKTNEPLGATVRNEGDAVIIGRVVRGGAADKSGLFHEGDEVLEVNGVEMRGKSVNEVCDILAGMQGGLTFLVLPASSNQRNNITNTRREDSAQIHHVRAHFDYDPEEDPYIPCRELGVSFQKGDVLHVISQEDSNWWQAYREGEEDHTLAGLIPSRVFQHQRESVKQTIAGGKSTIRGSKKSSTLLCTRKNPKKKKKKSKTGSNFNDEGYPLYATTTIDDYDSEEVLTYEEVALYYPRANHKRPIVLIGPPNIGRHELRQRLMQDSERFAAAIPHTSRPRKGSEVDGQDYHFISRSQFESDILCRKFVEHGEYEKAYYGTSVEAIRSVVNSGKICVLNLHPQSLKILRSSDLKPYVVFVAPPSLEKLRQKRIKNNESFKEEELKDIIEKAREMEDKYGHLFDMIILNNDTDRAYNQLLTEINSLEREPQWVPASWVQ